MKRIFGIAETAWHHEGDFDFMMKLVEDIVTRTQAEFIKVHLLLDLDEYMLPSHPLYSAIKDWMLSEAQWDQILTMIHRSDKQLIILANDTKAVQFGVQYQPSIVEVHATCINDVHLLESIRLNVGADVLVALGISGCTIEEIEFARSVLEIPWERLVLAFGFQNYPTDIANINFGKLRRLRVLYPYSQFIYADHTKWDHPDNLLVTLIGAAQGVQYVEKHVTNVWGEKRIDSEAAISIEMFNELCTQLRLLERCLGEDALLLGVAEQEYMAPGIMKKVPVLMTDVKQGGVLRWENIGFKRSPYVPDAAKEELRYPWRYAFERDLAAGTILCKKDLRKIETTEQ